MQTTGNSDFCLPVQLHCTRRRHICCRKAVVNALLNCCTLYVPSVYIPARETMGVILVGSSSEFQSHVSKQGGVRCLCLCAASFTRGSRHEPIHLAARRRNEHFQVKCVDASMCCARCRPHARAQQLVAWQTRPCALRSQLTRRRLLRCTYP